jgi:hypothetical protein
LTDPSIKGSVYLFHIDNPLSEPPGDLEYMSDINTGAAHLKSYKKYVKIPGKQVLLLVILYIEKSSYGPPIFGFAHNSCKVYIWNFQLTGQI